PSIFTCLTKSCVSPALRSTSSGVKEASFSRTIFRTIASDRSRAPRIYSSLRASSPSIVRRDHAAIGDDADTSDGKAVTQTVDDGQQRGDVGRIAQPHLRADRPPGAIDN